MRKLKKYDFHILIWAVLLSLNIIDASLRCDIWLIKKPLFIINTIYIVSFYLQFSLICPKYFNKKNKLPIVLLTISNITLSLFIVVYTIKTVPFDACSLFGATKDDFLNFKNNTVYNFIFLFTTVKMNLLIVLLALIAYVLEIRLNQKYLINELENTYLKNQISPHFLLNSLNNIYSLAIQKSEKILPQIENLSELLKYSLYKIQYDEIALIDEVEHIQLYLNTILTKTTDQFNIVIEINALPSSIIKIKPLILFNFIENAVKHSKIESNKSAWIKLKVEYIDKELHFVIQNSKANFTSTNTYSGIGLTNTKQRLETFYSEKYKLNIKDNQMSYEVNLRINLE